MITLLQIAEVTGASGISFCVMAVAAIPAGLVCLRMGEPTRRDIASTMVYAGGSLLICYEDTVAANARQTVVRGAQVLFSRMNASAFENPLTLEQHMRLSLLRSVENRDYVARCAATGVSCIITAAERVVQRADTNAEATLVAELPLNNALTDYTRFGFLFTRVCLILTFLFVILHWKQ